LNPLPPDPAPITPGNLALREELKEFHGKLKELDAATKKRQPPKSLRSDFSTYRDCLQKRVDILRLEASFDPNSTVVKSELKAWTHAFPKWLANFQRTRSVVESWLEKQHKKAGTSDRSLAVEQDTKAVPKATIRRSNAGVRQPQSGLADGHRLREIAGRAKVAGLKARSKCCAGKRFDSFMRGSRI